MKKNKIIKVVLVTVLVLMLFTWIFPAAYFSGEYTEQGRIQMGIFDLFNYPVTALSYFGHIALFLLIIGGFYGVLYKIPAYNSFLNKVSDKLKKNGKFVISLIAIINAILVSICGLQIGALVFFPMLVSIIILMGYDKMTAALTLIGSTVVGLAGTTLAYSNESIILSVLGVDFTYEMLTRVVVLLIGLVLLIFNIVIYIRKRELVLISSTKEVKKSTSKAEVVKEVKDTKKTSVKTSNTKTSSAKKSNSSKATVKKSSKSSRKDIKAAVKEDDVIVVKDQSDDSYLVPQNGDKVNHSIWPFVVSFSILFVIMVLAFISWSTGFNNTAFTSATSSVLDFELFGFPLFGKLLGTVKEFGSWTIVDLSVVMFFVLLFLTIVYKTKCSDICEGFMDGLKKALPLGVIVILAYTCLVITTYHPFQLVIYKSLLALSNKLDAFIGMIVGMIAGVFNVEPLYAYQSVLPYLASITDNTNLYPIIGALFQAAYGLSMLIAPTSVVLMCVLCYLDVPYTKWIKTIWKLLLELFVIFTVLFIVSGLSFLVGLGIVVSIIVIIMMYVAYWKVFEKAGQKGWAALVPFYNAYVLFKIAGYNGWLSLLMLIPIVNIVFMILVDVKLAHKFGKSSGFVVGLILLPFVFYMILALDKSKYNNK